MIQMQQAMMEQFNLVMASLGVELKLEKIDIEPEDDPNAIDFIWRLKCRDPEIAREIKRKFIEQYGESE
jgi:hypothetical protein